MVIKFLDIQNKLLLKILIFRLLIQLFMDNSHGIHKKLCM